ncbi:transcriptional regulator [Mycolicibacter heraklionensis]|uniref:Transcriptional regulator n=1 Tax=Mycolicibacter heraklionensis TaxID=512402 RepID=A0ABR5FDT1_9MYCO|nr:transcriptional regulator [Mycolicibacter heraklionensis]
MRQVAFKRARSDANKRQRAEALMEAARSVAIETGVASVTLTAVAGRAGVHHSAVRRYFSSHKEVLLRLAAESWEGWSDTVCTALQQSEAMSPDRVAATLASGLAADPLFCDMLANLHLHLDHEVDAERVIEIRRKITAAGLTMADALLQALPRLGKQGAFDLLLASYSLAAPLWQVAHPPTKLADAYAAERQVPPEWNLDFTTALTRLLTATCVGLLRPPDSVPAKA